jgi:uncharacterized protein (TIGR03437 family)
LKRLSRTQKPRDSFSWRIPPALAVGSVKKNHPAQRGETVLIYGTGWDGGKLLGKPPPAAYCQLSSLANPLADLKDFHVLINGTPLPSTSILYAGTTPECPAFISGSSNYPRS